MDSPVSDEALKRLRNFVKSDTSDNVISISAHIEGPLPLDPGNLPLSHVDFDNLLDPPDKAHSAAVDEKLKKVMEKSILNHTEFVSNEAPLNPIVGYYQRKKLGKKIRAETAGKNWFHMKATELTDDDKLDRELMKMKDLIYPGNFVKKSQLKDLDQAKFVQVGTWQDSPLDFYSKKKVKRKKTMIDTLLADAEFKHKNKMKYLKLQASKQTASRSRRKTTNANNKDSKNVAAKKKKMK